MSKTSNTILALVTGAAIGAGLGLSYAPESGDKTRKKISKNAKEAKKKLEKQIQETSDNLSASAKEAKKSFDAKLEDTLKTASSKADNILVSMEKKLEELRKKNAKATTEVVEEVKDIDVPTAKA